MNREKIISNLVEIIKLYCEDFLEVPKQCAHTDSIAEKICCYGRELEQIVTEEFHES